ncbi:MAG: YbhB/YbcL family Raf kinase inhibitor-like protein [Deltaproteobacteria bacterium]|nr:YbhB/YbcL family Raf kinase inhibitor-like protein [Deltaproteobacteria bacterium]
MAIQLISEAFSEGAMIPTRYTCDGEDVSPPLSWTELPPETGSFALICEDPDAPVGTWDHWVLFNIPASATGLPEAVPATATLDDGSVHGNNSWGRLGYGGPCPPGGTHRYIFSLFALDIKLDLKSGATKSGLLKAMEGHILARTRLTGKYRR